MPSYYVGEDCHLQSNNLSLNEEIDMVQNHPLWRRLCLALRTPSGACHKRRSFPAVNISTLSAFTNASALFIDWLFVSLLCTLFRPQFACYRDKLLNCHCMVSGDMSAVN